MRRPYYSKPDTETEKVVEGCINIIMSLFFFPTVLWLFWTVFGFGHLFNFLPETWQSLGFWTFVVLNLLMSIVVKWIKSL